MKLLVQELIDIITVAVVTQNLKLIDSLQNSVVLPLINGELQQTVEHKSSHILYFTYWQAVVYTMRAVPFCCLTTHVFSTLF